MKIFLTLCLLFSSLTSQAFFEKKLAGAASNKPSGGVINTALAYNYKVWDDSETTFWKYGYLRPKASFDTSFLINTVGAELQVYPISIFGVAVGSNYAYRSIKHNDEFDCDLVNCKGEVHRNYFRANANLGFGKFISSLTYQVEYFYNSKDDQLPSVEFNTLLLIPHKDGRQERRIAFLGYKWSDTIDIGVLGMRNEMTAGGTSETKKSEAGYLVGSFKVDDLKWQAGLGTYGSDYNPSGLSALLKVTWVLDPTLSLND